MEGIRDGRAVDDCVHCVFIDPGVNPCPHCKNRMRYIAAELTDADERENAVTAWRSGRREPQLLETLWRLGFRPDDDSPM